MNKTELIAKVSEATGASKKESTTHVEAVLDIIAETLASGETIKIVGFGNFSVRTREARKGLNPKLFKELREQGVDEETAKAQASVDIAASVVPTFKAAKGLKDKVNI